MKRNCFIAIVLVLLVWCKIGCSQSFSSLGTDFWVCFTTASMGGELSDSEHAVWICSQQGCTGQIVNPRTGWSQNFEVAPESAHKVVTPIHGLNGWGGQYNGGFHITTSDLATVYVTNEAGFFEASGVLPTAALSDEYYVQTFGNRVMDIAEFAIVATEDDTSIDITPTCRVYSGDHPANQTFTIHLNAGQVFSASTWLIGATNLTDYTRSHIVSHEGKKIAVLAGNNVARVPEDTGRSQNHLCELMVPLNRWGRYFVTTRSKDRLHDFVRIMPTAGGFCKIWRDGTLLANHSTLSTRAYFSELPNETMASYWETEKLSLNYHFVGSDWFVDPSFFGPSMSFVQDISRVMDSVVFVSFDLEQMVHFVNVVADREAVDGILLDGISISNQFQPLASNPNFAVAQVPLEAGPHTLIGRLGGFNARAYGYCDPQAPEISSLCYSYDVGNSRQRPIANLIAEVDSICQGQYADFELQTLILYSEILWDFGDGTTGEGATVSHQFGQFGDFQVEVSLYDLSGNLAASFTKNVFVKPSHEIVTEAFTCDESYVWNGQTFTESGTYEQAFVTTEGCDSICILHLTIGGTYQGEFSVNVCDSYVWNDITYSESGDYEQLFTSVDGCDSIVTLHLAIENAIYNAFSVNTCDSYVWNGITYSLSGDYEQIFTSVDGCDSIVTLNLTIAKSIVNEMEMTACNQLEWNGLVYSENGIYEQGFVTSLGCDSLVILNLTIESQPEISIIGDHQIAYSTNLWTGIYHYFVDSTGIDPSTLHWEGDRPEWQIWPHGASCTLIAWTSGQAELKVWLDMEVCEASDVIQLNATYHDVTENINHGIKVYPNPTRGAIVIEGDEISAIRVYDVLGELVKQCHCKGNQVECDLSGLRPAIYLLEVISAKEHVRQKIVVE